MVDHNLSDDSVHLGQYGRYLTPLEQAAHNEYEQVLDRLHEQYRVKMYDRVSVMKAFPELQEAWEGIQAVSTYYTLKGGITEEDYDKEN